jgi:two-component system, OmpR family, sensor histidine kinase CpxA
MPGLFVKIFFCFLVIIILVGTSLETSTFLARYYERSWQIVLHSIMPMEAEKSARMFETDGKEALQNYLDELQSRKTVRFYFFDEDGSSLIDRGAPHVVYQHVKNKDALERVYKQNLSSVLPRLGLAARLVYGPSGKRYIFAFQQSPTLIMPVAEKIEAHPYLRLSVITLLAVGLCLLLTLHITRPLSKLRVAASNIADGRLKTRVSKEIGWRHDEIANLGRDFDRMADQIETLVTAQRNLLGDVSHELRSPLARLIVALSLLKQGQGEETLEYQNRIGLEAERLDKLIGQLLTLTRIDSGVDAGGREAFDLTNLVQEVAADGDFEGRAHNRGVKVTSADPCQITGVPDLMRSAVENVIRNAVRHTQEGTTVEVAVERYSGMPWNGGEAPGKPDVDMVRIQVRDYGPGVREGMLREIFQPFHRGSQNLSGNGNGTSNPGDLPLEGAGLGLAIADRVVRMHNGTIQAHNAIGNGLVIEIRLPVS